MPNTNRAADPITALLEAVDQQLDQLKLADRASAAECGRAYVAASEEARRESEAALVRLWAQQSCTTKVAQPTLVLPADVVTTARTS